MTGFESPDLVPLPDDPADLLPLRPVPGEHRWRFDRVRRELLSMVSRLPKGRPEPRVALLSHPGMSAAVATDGLSAGIHMLLPGESAEPHRHGPTTVRVGLVAGGVVTTVDDEEYRLQPLDVIINPSWTWHGHHADPEGEGGLWLDVVDLPLVAALGGPPADARTGARDEAAPRASGSREPIRHPWREVEAALWSSAPVDGQRIHEYATPALRTMAVTAFGLDPGARLHFPARPGGSLLLVASGRHLVQDEEAEPLDMVALRAWTPCDVECTVGPGAILCIDTSPASRRLGICAPHEG